MVGRTVAFAHNVEGHGGAPESVSTCPKVDLRRVISEGDGWCLNGVEFGLSLGLGYICFSREDSVGGGDNAEDEGFSPLLEAKRVSAMLM